MNGLSVCLSVCLVCWTRGECGIVGRPTYGKPNENFGRNHGGGNQPQFTGTVRPRGNTRHRVNRESIFANLDALF